MEDKYLYMIRKAQEFMNENHFADGGNNLIAPTASQAEQKLVEKPADEIKKDKE